MNPQNLEYITIDPTTEIKYCVIWLHGLGADANDFVPIVKQLQLPENHGIQFIFPNAPIRPVTLNGNMHMRAWYDIYSLNDLNHEDVAGIKQTAKQIEALIQQQIDAGIASEHIFLAGFSQGGAMALYTGLHYPKKLAGLLILSAYLPLATELKTTLHIANKNTPIFISHGEHDPVLPIRLGEMTRDFLQTEGYPVSWQSYPMAHEVCAAQIRWLGSGLELTGFG